MAAPIPRSLGAAALIAVGATQLGCTYESQGAPLPYPDQELRIVRRSPAPADVDVPINPRVVIEFGAPLDAYLIDSSDLRLLAGILEVPGTLKVDHLERTLTLSAIEVLREGLSHTVLLRAGIRAYDGSFSAREQSYSFTTGSRILPSPPASPFIRHQELEALFGDHCARCHRGPDPPRGVDLASLDSARSSLVGRASATDDLLVVVGDHARSYLIRKIEGLYAILGSRMPPDAPPLSPNELRLVADWIDTLGSSDLN